tara:strand:- start:10342 stop:11004 length:663 start_codon:yes stop_codon:yes gene_type:complete
MIYQIHLWLGLVLGLYVMVISVSGSAVVFRRELTRWFLPKEGLQNVEYPLTLIVLEWFVDLHDNLLAGNIGRDLNGIGAILFLIMVLTGAFVWWPGVRQWKQSLFVCHSQHRLFSWHLHSVIGFWSLLFLLGWSVTGIYFIFPGPFEWFFDVFDKDLSDFKRPGEGLLLVLVDLHFGRFGGLGIRTLWVIFGLLPTVLFITGVRIWWKRVQIKWCKSWDT